VEKGLAYANDLPGFGIDWNDAALAAVTVKTS
jgi:hypothetical protein